MWNELEERTSFTHASVRLSSVASLPSITFNKVTLHEFEESDLQHPRRVFGKE
jgi:hypothetical protein